MSQTALRYALQLSNDATRNLTYVTAGGRATFSFIVANPGRPVAVTSIAFQFAPFGANASNLVESANALIPHPPDGWKVAPDNPVTFVPVDGTATIGTAPVVFRVDADINAVSGVAKIFVTEITAESGARSGDPFVVTKMANTFVLANLRATPPSVALNESVTLWWDGTAGQDYAIYDSSSGQIARITCPSGGAAWWRSAPIRTSAQAVTFTVSATRQEFGQTLSVETSTTVPVDSPQIVSFTGPEAACFQSGALLHWETANADHCRVLVNGQLLDDKAPATTTASGYHVTLSRRVTQFQLVAVKGNASVTSPQVVVTNYAWTIARKLTVETPSPDLFYQAIAVSLDGTRLAYGGARGVTLIDARTMGVVSTVALSAAVAHHGLAFTRDGNTLLVSTLDDQLHRLTFNGAWEHHRAPIPHGPVALGRDGARVYVAAAAPARWQLSYVDAVNLQLIMGLQLPNTIGATGIAVSDDNVVFVNAMKPGAVSNLLYLANDKGETWSVASVLGSALALAPDGERVFLMDESTDFTGPVGIQYTTRAGQLHHALTFYTPAHGCVDQFPALACDTDGNVYAYTAWSGLYYADLSMRTSGPVPTPTVPGVSSRPDIAVDSSGALYVAEGGTISVLVSNANRPVFATAPSSPHATAQLSLAVARANATNASPKLRYSLQLSQDSVSGLTYVNVGQRATLTLIVANPGAAVTVECISVDFPAFGAAATDLVQSNNDVTVSVPAGWEVIPSTNFTLRPTAGFATISTAPLTFVFDATINGSAGIAQIGITEQTTSGTAFLSPAFLVTKMPANFALSNLVASPTLVEPNNTVTLTWTGTPNQPYTISYPNGTAIVTSPSGGLTSWTSAGVQTTYPAMTFTVESTLQENGQVLVAEASTTVNVDVPQILGFVQPETPFFSLPIPLSWQTQNADYCRLYANGRLIDAQAPANTPVSGYEVNPGAHSTQYALYAVRHSTSTLPIIATINLFTWRQVAVVWLDDTNMQLGNNGNNNAACTALALSPDGGTLFYASVRMVYAIDTTRNVAVAQWQVPIDDTEMGSQNSNLDVTLAVSPNGGTVYVGVLSTDGGSLYALSAPNLSGGRYAMGVAPSAVAPAPDGLRVYFAGNNELGFVDANGNVVRISWLNQLERVTGLILAPDSSCVYFVGTDSAGSAMGPLYRCDLTSGTTTTVAQIGIGPLVLSGDGMSLYCVGAPANGRQTISEYSLPDLALQSTVAVGPAASDACIDSIAGDGMGGIYATVRTSAGSTLTFIDSISGATTVIHDAVPQGAPGAVAVSSDGSRVYASGIATGHSGSDPYGTVLALASNVLSPTMATAYRYSTPPTAATVI